MPSLQLSIAEPKTLARRVEGRIVRFAANAPRLLVAWSGGKDSTAALLATYHCCREKLYASFIHLVGQTHALNVQTVLRVAKLLGMDIVYLDACGRRFRQPLASLPRPPALIYVRSHGRLCKGFWEEAKTRGWPAPMERTTKPGKRWCCTVFKSEPLEALASIGFKWHIVGVKASDSHYRAKQLAGLSKEQPVKHYGSHINLYPIYDLSDGDIWSIIKHYDPDIYGAVKQQYDVFGYSPNCLVCPLQSKKNFQRTIKQMPTQWLERTRQVLLLLQKHSCTKYPGKWTCRDLTFRLEEIEKELAKRDNHD